MKILVAYFSRTGHTRRVAERVAAALHADLAPITERASRAGPLGYLRSAVDAVLARPSAIERSAHDPAAGYDLVVIGTPVWVWRLPAPVRAWLRRHRAGLPAYAVFCTMGGSGADGVIAEVARLAGAPPRATLALTDAQIDGRGADAALDAFVGALRRPAR